MLIRRCSASKITYGKRDHDDYRKAPMAPLNASHSPPRCTRTCTVDLPRPCRLLPRLPFDLTHQLLRSPYDLVLRLLRGGTPLLHNLGPRPRCCSCSLGLRDATGSRCVGTWLGCIGCSCRALLRCNCILDLLHDAWLAVAGTGAC